MNNVAVILLSPHRSRPVASRRLAHAVQQGSPPTATLTRPRESRWADPATPRPHDPPTPRPHKGPTTASVIHRGGRLGRIPTFA